MGIIRTSLKVTLAFLLIAAFSFAQTAIKKSTKTETVNGKKYYIHRIEKGETLYSIGKAYEVSANDIVVENPEAIDGLKPGQDLKIPAKEEPKKDPFFFKGPYHVVKKGETLYSLSKFYNVSAEELNKLNPELRETGLKLGQILRLPDNTANGQLAVPVKKDTVVAVIKPPVIKDTTDLRVALILPLFTSLNTDEKEYKDNNDKSTICPKSQIGVSFYEGAMTAIDSLRKLGFSGTIYTYDSENDSISIENVMKKPELKEMDLIIGPLYTSNFKRVSDFAKKNQIPLVSPFSQVSRILLGNPYIFKATPSVTTQIEEIASYVSEKGKDKKIVLLSSDNPKEKVFTDLFLRRYYSEPQKDSVKIISIKKSGTGVIDNIATGGKEVWAVALSNDQVFVTDLVNKLNSLKLPELRLFGLESWSGFESLDPEYLQRLHTTLSLPQFADLESDKGKQFIRSYRSRYHTDPDKFALHAFDVTWYFVKRLKEEGRNFAVSDPVRGEGFQTNFNFVKSAVESGFENKFTNMVEYKDFRLEKIN